MFKRNAGFIFLLFILFIIPSLSFAQKSEEEKYTKYPIAGRPEKIRHKKGKLRLGASLMQGFDNNVNLDSTRKGDTFQETILNVDYRYKYSKKTNIGAGFNSTYINYDNYTENSLLDNIFKLYWTRKLFKIFTFQKIYQLEYLYFPKDDKSSYVENDLGFNLRHDIYKGLFHSFGYVFLTRNYTARNKRFADAAYSDTKRLDYRNLINYDIGYSFKKLFLKMGYQGYINESNERYRDYYDYYSNKGMLRFGYNFTDKLFLYTGFGFEQRRYKDRRQIDGNTSAEIDNTYTFNSSLIYNITRAFSANIDYSYRENHSNVPSQKYSGSLTAIGLNYIF